MLDRAKKSLHIRSIIILFICFADIAWAAYFIYTWQQNGTIISVKNASNNLAGIFSQHIIISAIPILLFLICRVVLKKRFATEMYTRITSKKQWIIIFTLLSILLGITTYCLITKTDTITIVYNLLYYTVFVAFTEEFVVRDVCTYLLKEEKRYIRYLVPNILFAAMHLFSYANWGQITVVYVVQFVSSQMLGLVVMGCAFQYLKEKSNSIWVPVLVHAIMDYLVVLGY